jgi:hypothetical protein
MTLDRRQLTKEDAELIAEAVLEKAVEHADQAIGKGLRGWLFKIILMVLIFVLGIAASKGIKP